MFVEGNLGKKKSIGIRTMSLKPMLTLLMNALWLSTVSLHETKKGSNNCSKKNEPDYYCSNSMNRVGLLFWCGYEAD